jgi:hypothetical protein
VLSTYQVPTEIEQLTNSGMGTQESPSLLYAFKLAHPPLPGPRSLMRLLGPIILILFSAVDRLR